MASDLGKRVVKLERELQELKKQQTAKEILERTNRAREQARQRMQQSNGQG